MRISPLDGVPNFLNLSVPEGKLDLNLDIVGI